MALNQLVITSRSATFEIDNNQAYKCEENYDVLLNGTVVIKNENKNVFSLFDLQPNTSYEIELVTREKRFCQTTFKTNDEWLCLNVKKFGAIGDGIHEDTPAIQGAILAAPKGTTVRIPKGEYLVAPLFLKDDITLQLDEGAVLKLSHDRSRFPILPGYTLANNEEEEYLLGTWEGNPLDMFASLITGIGVKNVNIIGKGTLDGDAQNADWWDYPRVKKGGAYRPRMIFLNQCENITVQGINVQNSPCWTIHPYLSKNIDIIDIAITNDKNSPNTDGIDPESCEGLRLIGINFSVGDDCIAIKAGKLYMGMTYHRPSKDFIIRNCIMQYGHGAVVIGSEMSGGVKNITVERCIFKQTDRGLRIKTRRGRGKYAVIEAVTFKNIVMDDVLTPFVVNMFYFCDPDGKSEYVWSKEKYPVDDWTPHLGGFHFEEIVCTGAEVAGGYFAGLPEMPIESVSFEKVSIHFKKEAKVGTPAMMSYTDPVKHLGLYFMNVREVSIKDMTITGYEGQAIQTDKVDRIKSNFKG